MSSVWAMSLPPAFSVGNEVGISTFERDNPRAGNTLGDPNLCKRSVHLPAGSQMLGLPKQDLPWFLLRSNIAWRGQTKKVQKHQTGKRRLLRFGFLIVDFY